MTPAKPNQPTQTFSRRAFLKRASGVSLVLVAGGGVYRASSQGVFSSAEGPAYEAWSDWRTRPEPGPLRLVQSAILAANPHNTQPWLFRVTASRVELFADTSRHLGTMDPYLREMHLGLGCALENMLLTAKAEGYDVRLGRASGDLTLSQNNGLTSVATLGLEPSTTEASPPYDALYDAIPERHTDRSPYAEQAVSRDDLEALRALVSEENVALFLYEQGNPEFQAFADATVAATEFIVADAAMSRDSHAWFDANWQEVQRDKDGPFIDTAGVPPLTRALVKMLPPSPDRVLDSGWLSGTRSTLEQTPLLGMIAVRDLYSKGQTLNAGRVWQRLHLWATSKGLTMQPVNQLPERVDREKQLGTPATTAQLLDDLTGDPDWRPTFTFRAGYPENPVRPSSRRPVSEVLV